jgi:hypothetical protein
MPCAVSFLPVRNNDKTRCDFDISHVGTTIPEPYFDIYGFEVLALNDKISFELPRLRFSATANEAKVKFQLLEETEGFLDYFVEVYVTELTIPLQNAVPPTTVADTTIPDAEVNHSPVYTFTVPIDAASGSPDLVVLQLP